MSAEIVIYNEFGKNICLAFDPEQETVWASQSQIIDLFDIDQSGVSRHINNVFKSGEVDKESNMQKMHNSRSDKPIALYSLDVILSVGYRANSSKAIQFRKWANSVLKRYIIEGAAVNEFRLEQMGHITKILSRSSDEMVSGIADVLDRFSGGLNLLDSYDHQMLSKPRGDTSEWMLTYDEARAFVDSMRFSENSDLFGVERDDSFKGIVAGLYQSFGGIDLYSSVQEKAANLLYLVVKDHSFTDGNKRIAAALFVYFLEKNNGLRRSDGELLVNNNALAAITLMIALSHPNEKEIMCLLLMNMLDTE